MDNNFTPVAARELSANHLGRFVEVGELSTVIRGPLEAIRFTLQPREANSARRTTVELAVFAAGAQRLVSVAPEDEVGVEDEVAGESVFYV